MKTEPLPEFHIILYPITAGAPIFAGAEYVKAIELEVLDVKTGVGGVSGTVPATIFLAVESVPCPTTLMAATVKK